jgi:hypothetical protein
MRSPLVERQAHLIEVVVFVVDPGHASRNMVEDALGNCIDYTELRKTRPASPAQVVRRECADAMFRKGFQIARDHARDELRVARLIAVLGWNDIATAVGNSP